jgi:predicted enzyme related to lactoylglutathione lyase
MSAAATHIISWFEIPSTDFERAVRFYETVLATELRRENVGDQPIGIFQYAEPATGGCVIHGPTAKPSADGVVVYLNAQPNVDAVLALVEKAGGKVQGPVVELPQDIGYIGFFTDTEGNRIGLHSPKNP